jgi:CRISPR-associated endonuclease/helicase Cas3
MDIDLTTAFNSHTGKLLQTHISGVMTKVKYRTENLPKTLNLKFAEIAALFHDLGKINPHFQRKLNGEKVKEYSSHAYLSAYSWFRFCLSNQNQVAEWLGERERIKQRYKSLGMIISKHHGNLADFAPGTENNFAGGIFNNGKARAISPADECVRFIKEYSDLPISNFLQILLPHNEFLLSCSEEELKEIFKVRLDISVKGAEIQNPIEFFLETQFCFSCVLEADKRDAGKNEEYKRRDLHESYFKTNFNKKVNRKLDSFTEKSPLNNLRTAMRLESSANLREILSKNKDKRVFTLSAPTGAGKTIMLLDLAKVILEKDKELSVIYALPFLSITEQVENICRKIFDNFDNNVLRIDSRAENQTIQELQKKLDAEQTDENVKRLIKESFTETTFDHPFIITTFVQVFETLLSNRNATLLRLPNFSKTIFLIDEIQALPYRLYSFFTAFLDEFCRHFDSYAIISTATMPHLDFSEQQGATHTAGRKLFFKYKTPVELLDAPKYFSEKVFNRYRVTRLLQEDFKMSDLAEHIENRDESCLVILNTIDDTKDLYALLSRRYSEQECLLLNTHFTLKDRKRKIWLSKRRLKQGKKIILISTQLIEAGVDIDFPTVYRDFCPLPSLIQSAGRRNRNGELKDKAGNLQLGEVVFFALRKEINGKLSSELIYRDEAKNFLKFCCNELNEIVTESELFEIQRKFFKTEIGEFLQFGVHNQYGEELDFVKLINKAAFEQLGKFKLIDERQFGYEFRYYIPRNWQDDEFETLQQLSNVKYSRDYNEARRNRIAVESHLRKMSARMVTFRVKDESLVPAANGEVFKTEKYAGIRQLGELSNYTFEKGIEINQKSGCFI